MEIERIAENHQKIDLAKVFSYGRLMADSHDKLPDLAVIDDINDYLQHGDEGENWCDLDLPPDYNDAEEQAFQQEMDAELGSQNEEVKENNAVRAKAPGKRNAEARPKAAKRFKKAKKD